MKGTYQPVPPLAERSKPGLSETLPYPRELGTCQACGLIVDPTDGVEMQRWQECDVFDRKTPVLVQLCRECSGRLITPHARLYHKIDSLAPWPGAMAICAGCRFAGGLACSSPLLKKNGGPGLPVHQVPPTQMHLNYGGGRGEFKNLYHGAPTKCDGFEAAP